MQNRKKIILVVSLILVTMLFAIVTFKPQAQDRTQPQEQQDEATVVQKGQVTEKEREFSKEIKKLNPIFASMGRKFSDLISHNARRGYTGDIIVGTGSPEYIFDPYARKLTAAEFLTNLTCSADAVVIGYVNSKTAHMTDDETFVYTDYEFTVKEIIKNNSLSPITVNNNIEIVRPGGSIRLDNRIIRVRDDAFEPLQKNKDYLLFLRFVPAADGYIVSDDKGDFALENNAFRKLSKRRFPEELESNKNSQTLLNSLRNSVSAGCRQNPAGGNLMWSSETGHNPHAAPFIFSFQLFFKFHWTFVA